jgi:hypothetical protein
VTMPKTVEDAVKNVSRSLRDTFIEEDIVHEQIAEIRAELHRLTEIAEGVEPLVIRLGEVTEAFQRSDEQAERLGNRLAAANALLRRCLVALDFRAADSTEGAAAYDMRTAIQSHLQGACDEA